MGPGAVNVGGKFKFYGRKISYNWNLKVQAGIYCSRGEQALGSVDGQRREDVALLPFKIYQRLIHNIRRQIHIP